MKKTFKFKTSNKLLLLSLIVSVILVVIVILINIFRVARAETYYSQYAGERWTGEKMKYGEVSVFYEDGGGIKKNDIRSIENKINQKLYDDSYLESRSESRVWIDGYCGQMAGTLRNNTNTQDVRIYAVGGDFFLIHPIPLAAGSYPDLTSSDKYQVLLDEYTAWNLFGSSNVAGLKIWMDDTIYTVTGVVRVSTDKDYLQAYGNKNSVYIPAEAFAKTTTDENAEDVLEITCYEAVVPNPIKNYALNTVTQAVGLEEESEEELKKQRSTLHFAGLEVVENTDRFGLVSLYKRDRDRKYVDMKTNHIVYPFWENLARFEQSREIKTVRLMAVLLIIPILTVLSGLVWLFRRRKVAYKPFIAIKDKISQKMENKKIKRYEELQRKKAEEAGMAEAVKKSDDTEASRDEQGSEVDDPEDANNETGDGEDE